ncbi:phage replisome organizer N-terminal domain-containing protein [Clostridium sp. C2-6-12]|uniref:phage replisome organizer N-terminal domain-containing protein n=1 Tax=Clostridium sp. C2-6-12 TaxID=2698832 RepID=UPI00136D7A32|nr:phage replisome organizer N-terminal domain-containing protein [Clostridium sp. C2-6-12]
MRERRYVKFKLDIYDDTKTKVIDQKPERDFIHYFFARCIILAGKSDCEGELYMAKNIPYTIETLAIEFNRDEALVKLALDVLMELKMIEVTEDNIYKVKSFVKHQNIKVEEKVNSKDRGIDLKHKEAATREVIIEAVNNKETNKSEEKAKNKVAENKSYPIINDDKVALPINNNQFNKDNNQSIKISDNISPSNIPILFDEKKNRKTANKKKKEHVINMSDEEERKDEDLVSFKEDEYVLGEGERLISAWTF